MHSGRSTAEPYQHYHWRAFKDLHPLLLLILERTLQAIEAQSGPRTMKQNFTLQRGPAPISPDIGVRSALVPIQRWIRMVGVY